MGRIKLFNAADALLRGYGWWMVYGREPTNRIEQFDVCAPDGLVTRVTFGADVFDGATAEDVAAKLITTVARERGRPDIVDEWLGVR